MRAKIMRIVGERDSQAPAWWLVFNAPRPLPGNVNWIGAFRHGIYFVAVDPRDSRARYFIETIVDLDGWLCRYVGEDEVKTWWERYRAEYGLDEATAWDDVVNEYMATHEVETVPSLDAWLSENGTGVE